MIDFPNVIQDRYQRLVWAVWLGCANASLLAAEWGISWNTADCLMRRALAKGLLNRYPGPGRRKGQWVYVATRRPHQEQA